MVRLIQNKFPPAFSSEIPIEKYSEHDILEKFIEEWNVQTSDVLTQDLQINRGDKEGKPKIEGEIACPWATIKRVAIENQAVAIQEQLSDLDLWIILDYSLLEWKEQVERQIGPLK